MSKTSYVFTKKFAACVSVRFLFHYRSFSPYCRAELFKAEVGKSRVSAKFEFRFER